MQGVERAWSPAEERRRVIRRIALLNADVRRLERLAHPLDADTDVDDAFRSVSHLRRQLAQEELGTQRAELDRLGAQLAGLGESSRSSGFGDRHADSLTSGTASLRQRADSGSRARRRPVLRRSVLMLAVGIAALLTVVGALARPF